MFIVKSRACRYLLDVEPAEPAAGVSPGRRYYGNRAASPHRHTRANQHTQRRTSPCRHSEPPLSCVCNNRLSHCHHIVIVRSVRDDLFFVTYLHGKYNNSFGDWLYTVLWVGNDWNSKTIVPKLKNFVCVRTLVIYSGCLITSSSSEL